MPKRTKAILITLGSIVGLALILALAYLSVFAWQTRSMTPLPTQEVVGGVYAVRDSFVNMYVLRGSDGYIAIDAGISPKNIARELAALKIDPQQVRALFLTHSDSDHTAAVSLFSNAALYLPKDEEQMINGQTPRSFGFGNRLKHAYSLLEQAQPIIVAGLTIEGLATPGHTPGSMSYLVNGTWLFVGDTMSLRDGKAGIFNNFFNMDSDRQRASITLLARLPNITAVFTGHYGATFRPQEAFAE